MAAGMGPFALVLSIIATIVVGLINGILISRTKVNPFIVTLGMYTILTSVALLMNNGGSVINLPPWLLGLTSWQLFGLPGIVYYTVGVVGYVAKGLKAGGVLPMDPELLAGMAVPVVCLLYTSRCV